MRYQPFPPKFHAANRAKLADAIGPDAIAIIDTAAVVKRPGDFEYPFRPDSNFYYLTGIDEPDAVLILAPSHPNKNLREILFLKETSDFLALWEGKRLTPEQGTERSGIKTVLWLTELDTIFDRLTNDFQTIFLNSEDHAAKLRESHPLHELHSAVPALSEMRTIKAPEEVEQIRRAIDITGQGLAKAWAAMQPGLPEYALEADLTAQFTRAGATGSAFSAIIAAGKNATVIHYTGKDSEINAEDLVLFDVGAEAGYYAADISRTVPVSGKFTDRQKAVYEAVCKAQQEGIKHHHPGTTILEIDAKMREVLTAEILKLGLTGELKTYYPHISHHLGLDVHDTGRPDQKLEPGMVVTCEPGLYIAEEGIGVRLEDVVLITEHGYEVLSADIPS
ncbi:MAG: aminopeptidase P family protein [Candidatus Saccharimonadales bacterium]